MSNSRARVLATRKQVLGSTHPYTATSLYNLALLLYNQDDYAAARSYIERALQILLQSLGENHPFTVTVRDNLTLILLAEKLANQDPGTAE